MNRRKFVLASSGSMLGTSALQMPRFLPLAGRISVAGASRLTLPMARIVTPHAAISAGLLAPGTVIVGWPTEAKAEFFTLAAIGAVTFVVATILKWNEDKAKELAESKNWQAGRSDGSFHAQFQDPNQLRPTARFVESNGSAMVDARDGRITLVNRTNASGDFQKDISPLEALALGTSAFPQGNREVPVGPAREKLAEAWVLMGGKLGRPDGRAFMRDYANASGDTRFIGSNGTINGQERLAIIPG